MKLTRTFTTHFIASIFIFLFTYTALSKFFDFKNFTNILGQSPLIGKVNILLGWALPLLELMTAVLLFFPKTRLSGLYASLFLMCVFTIYIGYMITFAPHLPCSCGGVIRQLTWKQHLLLNILLVSTAGIGIRVYKPHRDQEQNFLLQ